MRRLAYVAYFFPPTGGAGVQRSLKFARYLQEHGWNTTVVTVRESHYWMKDATLQAEIPPHVAVLRTPARTAPALFAALSRQRGPGQGGARRSGRSQRLLRRVSGFLLVPDPYVGWVSTATRAASQALAQGGIVLTTSSPDSAHLVGLTLARRGVPWVADFRDPWVRRMSFNPPTLLHRRLQCRLEARVVRTAARIVVTSDRTREDFLDRYPDLDANRITCIPNGYDEEDFPRDNPPLDSSFLIVHLGQLNPERRIGAFLDHLEGFFAIRPEARQRSRVEMIGPRYREDEVEVERRGFSDTVRFLDPLPHRQAILRLLSARVLLLLEQESDCGGLILPGKTFEYLRSGRPILALVPRGAAWDLITRFDAGRCALPSDPQNGAEFLAGSYDSYVAGEQQASARDPEEMGRFERRHLAHRMAELLDQVLNERTAGGP